MTPTTGRIVHYTAHTTQRVHAAIITKVNLDGSVELTIFGVREERYAGSVVQTEGQPGTKEAQGQWSWPPKV